MEFFALSPPEAAFLYTGFALQAYFRSWLTAMILIAVYPVTLYLLFRPVPPAARFLAARQAGTYFVVQTFICVLFFPEAVPIFVNSTPTISANQIGSMAADQDGGATIINAAQTNLVPPQAPSTVLIPIGWQVLYSAFSDIWLTTAQFLNSDVNRAFSYVVPMKWLFEIELSSDAKVAMQDFLAGCYAPARAMMVSSDAGPAFGPRFQDLLPWGNTLLTGELSQHQTIPGSHVGVLGPVRRALGTLGIGEPLRCDIYYNQLEQQVIAWLTAQQTATGNPIGSVIATELNMAPETPARFIIYRELLRQLGAAPDTDVSLGTAVGQIRYGSVTLKTLAGGAVGSIAGGAGAAAGAVAGGIYGAAGEFQQVLSRLTRLVSFASFLVNLAPYLIGTLTLIVIGLFPFTLLLALRPHALGTVLISYFILVGFLASTPVWFAIIDIIVELSRATAPDIWVLPGRWLERHVISLLMTSIGVIIVPIIFAYSVGVRSSGFLRSALGGGI